MPTGDCFQKDKAPVSKHFFTASTINVRIEEASSPPPPQTGDTALHFMASQHPELSSHCRAEQQKQSLFLDMIYTYSFFILLWSSYLHFTRYQFIKMKYFFYRWNNFLSIFATRGAWPRPWEEEAGGRERSVSQQAAGGIIIISPSHRTTGSAVKCSASTIVHPYSSYSLYSPRMYLCMFLN